MLVQGNDWFLVPFGQRVGSLMRVDQLLVRDVFGELTARGTPDTLARRQHPRLGVPQGRVGLGEGVSGLTFDLPQRASA